MYVNYLYLLPVYLCEDYVLFKIYIKYFLSLKLTIHIGTNLYFIKKIPAIYYIEGI